MNKEKIIFEIKSADDPIIYILNLRDKFCDPKLLYLSRYSSRTFGELPLDIVPKELAERFKNAYIDLAIELLSTDHEKFEDCPSWNTYSKIGDELADEINKHPSPYDY